MGTRGVIAEPVTQGIPEHGFIGRYHHWDSYPTGLGATLWALHRDRYDGDTTAMRAELIAAHPAGWSTINGADWDLEPGFTDCTTCDKPGWMHYVQNYPAHDLPRPEPYAPGTYAAYDHLAERPEVSPGPACYCHGSRAEEEMFVRSDGDDCGAEWAYVLADDALVIYERRWNRTGAHMTGMFGFGADAGEGYWLELTRAPWTGAEPNWEALEGIEVEA
jgi:hypothetical protein